MTLKTFAKATRCPHCGKRHDCASGEGGRLPEDGDRSLCADCDKWAVFDSTAPHGLRKATADEAVDLVTNPDVFRMSLAWSQVDKTSRKPKRIGER